LEYKSFFASSSRVVGCVFGGLLIGLPPIASYTELEARIVGHNRALHKVEAELMNARPLLASRLATLALTLDDLPNQHDFAELYLNTLTQRDGRRLSDLPSANMAIGVLRERINQKPHALRRGITSPEQRNRKLLVLQQARRHWTNLNSEESSK
jgi:hypothetical protein